MNFNNLCLFLFTDIWEIATKINYVKTFVKLKIAHCLHISAKQTNKVRLRDSLRTDARSVRLAFTNLIELTVCFLKHPFKQCNSPLNISSIKLETY